MSEGEIWKQSHNEEILCKNTFLGTTKCKALRIVLFDSFFRFFLSFIAPHTHTRQLFFSPPRVTQKPRGKEDSSRQKEAPIKREGRKEREKAHQNEENTGGNAVHQKPLNKRTHTIYTVRHRAPEKKKKGLPLSLISLSLLDSRFHQKAHNQQERGGG